MIIFDLLRIIAALMVFSIHYFIFVPSLPMAAQDVLSNGSYGVSIFFVMSGFLIFTSLERSKSIKEYYIKRAAKILPAYYAILIVGIILWDICFKIMPSDTYAHIGWLRYFLALNTWLPSNDYGYWNNLWGLWTISCFIFFYIVAPFLKKCINNYRKSLIFMLVMIPATYVVSKLMTYGYDMLGAANADRLAVDNPIYSLNTFAIGICAYYAYKEDKINSYLRVLVVLLCGCIGINWFNRITWGIMTGLVMMIFIGLEIKNEKVKSVIKTLSKYSFSLYLVHLLVIEIIDYYKITGTMYLVLAPIASVLCAVLLYNLVEKPCGNLLRSLHGKKI